MKGDNEKLQKFIKTTNKELLRSFLQKKASNTLDQKFFETGFDQGLDLPYKFLLKCTLPINKDDKGASSDQSRSNYQRLKAAELLHFLIRRVGRQREDSKKTKKLDAEFDLIGQSVRASLEDYQSFK